jgi:hypothetical protein
MPIPVALALAAAQGIYQGVKGIRQKNQAKKLKESKFIPEELLLNRDLAKQQAFSRRAPGAGQAEEQIRRNTANQISAAQRSAGGDAGKMAAITSAATSQANDATARLASQGQQFSENAFGRLGYANTAIAGQKRQNRAEYNQTKNALQAAGDQNIFNSIGNIASAGLAGIEAGAFDGIDAGTKSAANAKIAMGKDLNRVQAGGRGAGGGNLYIKEGRGMKKSARQAINKSAGGIGSILQRSKGPRFDPYTGEPNY